MDHRERTGRLYRRAAFVLIALLILCLAAAACAAEKETHTVVLKSGGSGSAGIDKNGKTSRIAVTPETETVPSDGRKWTLEELRQLAETAGNRFYAVRSFKKSISDRSGYRIRIGMLVACNIYSVLFHKPTSYVSIYHNTAQKDTA